MYNMYIPITYWLLAITITITITICRRSEFNYYYLTFFDADFEGLASNAELYIFNQEDRKIVRNRLGLIWATSWYMQWYMLCKVITANSSTKLYI